MAQRLRARLPLGKSEFPFLFSRRKLAEDRVNLILTLTDGIAAGSSRTYLDAYATGAPLEVTAAAPSSSRQQAKKALTSDASILAGTPQATFTLAGEIDESAADWVFTVAAADVATLAPELRTPEGHLNPEAFSDLVAIFHYQVN